MDLVLYRHLESETGEQIMTTKSVDERLIFGTFRDHHIQRIKDPPAPAATTACHA